MEIEDLKCLLKTRETESKKEIEMLQEKISLLSIQLLDEEKETEGLTEDIKLLKQQTQQQEQKIERQMQEGREREQDLQRQLQERERQLEEREREFQERERQLEEQIQVAESSWVVNRREITMTEVVLGKGGWGEVKVAGFRGLKVAAKCLYEVIISPYNIGTFSREMNIASKIRHPNLLQFIGATTEGNPMILTELMPTSLRKELESGGVAYPAILSISLDVACALNYLHLFKPHPILHRDVSSANVLLQTTGETWRAKVSYYGSANLQPLISRTTNPGNPLYAAPEAGNPREHSPAMDVFSYGVLLLEMITRRIPLPEERVGLIDSIRRASFRSLVERCLIVEYRHRPTMNDIITELNDTVY
ncbi:PREDICTED: probable serine/threonine-protein kinase drkD [Amphimedon queenslandica]|uniref:Protein kinase domain-containing protein n=1 Tax=Amphimedon queenslandica TaxID=400682 RepID=A0AAN0K0R0_AMPQE|nr:PREDICTED: probable serine/threonine-protein kinase drkD [Amphimedon queenslandica]|eukprot:XP_019862752.1 PREDICTED: probable serine/threonine-protein kinase drkD [Amphimedon queenslandica]